jgi:hypothetical protein
MPHEIEAGRLINRYGAGAVYGRLLGVREMRRINLAENLEHICRRWLEPKAGEWFAAHPEQMQLFQWAVKAHTHA